VIVYDNVYEALIIMAKPLGNADPDIPSVFVSQKSGIVMRKMVATGKTFALILPVSSQICFPFERTQLLFERTQLFCMPKSFETHKNSFGT
jgi:hypothetical protein